MKIEIFRGGISRNESGCPTKLKAVAAGWAINVQDIADEIEIREQARAHRFEINFA